MSLLSGMNGMLNDEAAMEAAVEMLLEGQVIAMEADEIIDEMVDIDDPDVDDLEDEIEEMEDEIADESYSAIHDQLLTQAISNMTKGMDDTEAYEAATESMLEYANSFYSDNEERVAVKNMIQKVSDEISMEALCGDSFLNSLIHPEEDYDTEDSTVGDDNGAADFLENKTLTDILNEDIDDTKSYGDGMADHSDNGTGAYPNSKDPANDPHPAIEATSEDDIDDLEDIDSALESILLEG